MATASIALPNQRKLFPFGILLAAILLVAAIVVVVHAHAVQRHGMDAEAIRKCLNDKGPYQVWKAMGEDTFYRICQLDDMRWGLQAIVKVGDVWHEKTAFIRSDGTWKALTEYLQRIATLYKGVLP